MLKRWQQLEAPKRQEGLLAQSFFHHQEETKWNVRNRALAQCFSPGLAVLGLTV